MEETVHLSEFVKSEGVCVSVNTLQQDLFVEFPKNFKLTNFLDYIFKGEDFNFSMYIEKEDPTSPNKELRKIYDTISNNLTSRSNI